MADNILLDLVTPERRLVTTEVEDLVGTAEKGEFGILPGHANYITLLKCGELSYKEPGGKRRYLAVTGGFAEVSLTDGVRIIAEAAEYAEEIDVDRCMLAKERAEKRLAEFDRAAQAENVARAEAALQRAMMRIKVASRK